MWFLGIIAAIAAFRFGMVFERGRIVRFLNSQSGWEYWLAKRSIP